MALDRTIHRCQQCGIVGRWTNDDGKRWWCKDHSPALSVYVKAPIPPPPPEMEGELIGQRLVMKVRR